MPRETRSTSASRLFTFTEAQLGEDENVTQSVSIISSSTNAYANEVGYRWSPVRFKYRSYNAKYNEMYINGNLANDAERGEFRYSFVGGLNNQTRNMESALPFESNNFSMTALGGSNNDFVKNLSTEKILSTEVGYQFQTSWLHANIQGYYSRLQDVTEYSMFYYDNANSFSYVSLSGINKHYYGEEQETGTYLDETFSSDFGKFTNVTVKGNAWAIDYQTAKATGYDNTSKTTTESEAYLVSSALDLSKSTAAYLQFDYILR